MNTNLVHNIARTIRGLSMDAIEAAKSGHPGLPLGCADIVACLYAYHLRFNPKQPHWPGRDRFVLSAGHGSMVLYSILHLAGYAVSLDDIKAFRQLDSKTPGHPEYGHTPGVEATTGPLGQGIAMGIGMALGQKHVEAIRNLTETSMITPRIYILAGDGCLMEGVSAEASSLAGHLKLANVTVIYDANSICLDGRTSACFTEDVAMRYKAYGWHVVKLDGHDCEAIHTVLTETKTPSKPVLIIAKTTIGKGAPNVEGSHEVHGKPMGADEVAQTKAYHGIPQSPLFHVDPAVTAFFDEKQGDYDDQVKQWQLAFDEWAATQPKKAIQWQHESIKIQPQALHALKTIPIKSHQATRSISHALIQVLAKECSAIIGGSADLSCSDATFIEASGSITSSEYHHRNIKYGVREFAMASMANGVALQGQLLPYVGTFLTFSDYCRNAIRLAALMRLRVIYQLTHDSVLLGEDGPTHQPVEHISSLRAMPGLQVIRPADQTEVRAAWLAALAYQGPTALILSRQSVTDLSETSIEGALKGGYVVKETEHDRPFDYGLISTGSELSLAAKVYTKLVEQNYHVRLISLPSFERFNQQSTEYRHAVLPHSIRHYCSIEAATSFGWHHYIGRDGLAISVDTFGKSGNGQAIQTDFGFTVDAIIEKIRDHMYNCKKEHQRTI